MALHTPVLRLHYGRHIRPFEELDLNLLTRDYQCKFCLSNLSWKRIEKDVVGGKYLAYVIEWCEKCGWWNAFKFWEDRTGEIIYRVLKSTPHLSEIDISSRTSNVSVVIEVVKNNYEDLKHVHWRVFEKMVQKALAWKGFNVIDISKWPTSGGDLLAIGTDGKKTIVEVKHWHYKPVGIGVIWKIKGALQDKAVIDPLYQNGLVVTSNKFTQYALQSMSSLNPNITSEETKFLAGVDFNGFIKWLDLLETREKDKVLASFSRVVNDDAMSEM